MAWFVKTNNLHLTFRKKRKNDMLVKLTVGSDKLIDRSHFISRQKY